MFDNEQFKRDRVNAFLSMDPTLIRSVMLRWCEFEMPAEQQAFWLEVHRTIVCTKGFPTSERFKSQKWIQSLGLQSPDVDL